MFTRFSVILIFLLSFMSLGGCASFLIGGGSDSENEADLDRGYSVSRNEGDEDSTPVSAGRKIASDSEDEKTETVGKNYHRAIETRDVVLGMSRNEVVQSWGEPSIREVAGTGEQGHERWTYRSRYSLQRNDRTVIFENGKVAGWYR
jgi:hypothetical protein